MYWTWPRLPNWSFFRRSPVAEEPARVPAYWDHGAPCTCGCNGGSPESYAIAQLRAVALLDRWRPGRVAPADADPQAVRAWKAEPKLMTAVGSDGGVFFIDECSEVYQADDTGMMHHWCLAILDGGMPVADRALAKLLLIQADEGLFTRTARGGPNTAYAQALRQAQPPIQEGRVPIVAGAPGYFIP